MFIPISGIENLGEYNIVGYHVNDTGESTILMAHAPANVARVTFAQMQKLYSKHSKGVTATPFHTSLSSIKSPTKMAKFFIQYGEHTCNAKILHAQKAPKGTGILDDELAKHPLFKAWIGRLKEQAQIILKDKPDFAYQSAEKAARNELTELLTGFQSKYKKHGWDLNKIHSVYDEVFKELLVKHVLEV